MRDYKQVCVYLYPEMELCVCVCATHLALLVQWFYSERIGSDVNNRAQLEPIGGVGSPHWPPILHDSLLGGTTTQLVEGRTETQTKLRQGKKHAVRK